MKSISLFNDSHISVPDLKLTDRNFSGLAPGEIFALPNDANFDANHLSEALTLYATGLPDEMGLEAALEAVAPSLPTGRSFSYLQQNEKALLQLDSDDKDIREIGGKFSEIQGRGTQADGRTDNKGLIIAIDNDEGGEDAAVQQYHVRSIMNRLLRNDIYRATVLLAANDVEDSTNNWGPAASVDPDADLLAMCDASFTANGVKPTVVVLGGQAAVRRKLALRRLTTAGGFANAAMTNEQLAAFLGVRRVVELDALYQSSATAKSRLLAMPCYAYLAEAGGTKNDPSNLKRFVTMTSSGKFRIYIIPDLKRTLVAVEHYSRIVCARTTGIASVVPTYT